MALLTPVLHDKCFSKCFKTTLASFKEYFAFPGFIKDVPHADVITVEAIPDGVELGVPVVYVLV